MGFFSNLSCLGARKFATGKERPISPFLTVYKPEITSIFSIFERITGILLVLVVYFGVILLRLESLLLSEYWYYSLCYGLIKGSIGGVILGTLLLFMILALVYHIIFGIRYLYWDRVFTQVTIESLKKTTGILLGATVVLTLIIWFSLS